LILLTLKLNSKQYQECETLITRIEVRIMRLKRKKGERIKGALQATQDPNVPNNNTGIILSNSIENTASIIYQWVRFSIQIDPSVVDA
jgi:hypothetical protein